MPFFTTIFLFLYVLTGNTITYIPLVNSKNKLNDLIFKFHLRLADFDTTNDKFQITSLRIFTGLIFLLYYDTLAFYAIFKISSPINQNSFLLFLSVCLFILMFGTNTLKSIKKDLLKLGGLCSFLVIVWLLFDFSVSLSINPNTKIIDVISIKLLYCYTPLLIILSLKILLTLLYKKLFLNLWKRLINDSTRKKAIYPYIVLAKLNTLFLFILYLVEN
jgi:hypothetical protein